MEPDTCGVHQLPNTFCCKEATCEGKIFCPSPAHFNQHCHKGTLRLMSITKLRKLLSNQDSLTEEELQVYLCRARAYFQEVRRLFEEVVKKAQNQFLAELRGISLNTVAIDPQKLATIQKLRSSSKCSAQQLNELAAIKQKLLSLTKEQKVQSILSKIEGLQKQLTFAVDFESEAQSLSFLRSKQVVENQLPEFQLKAAELNSMVFSVKRPGKLKYVQLFRVVKVSQTHKKNSLKWELKKDGKSVGSGEMKVSGAKVLGISHLSIDLERGDYTFQVKSSTAISVQPVDKKSKDWAPGEGPRLFCNLLIS